MKKPGRPQRTAMTYNLAYRSLCSLHFAISGPRPSHRRRASFLGIKSTVLAGGRCSRPGLAWGYCLGSGQAIVAYVGRQLRAGLRAWETGRPTPIHALTTLKPRDRWLGESYGEAGRIQGFTKSQPSLRGRLLRVGPVAKDPQRRNPAGALFHRPKLGPPEISRRHGAAPHTQVANTTLDRAIGHVSRPDVTGLNLVSPWKNTSASVSPWHHVAWLFVRAARYAATRGRPTQVRFLASRLFFAPTFHPRRCSGK